MKLYRAGELPTDNAKGGLLIRHRLVEKGICKTILLKDRVGISYNIYTPKTKIEYQWPNIFKKEKNIILVHYHINQFNSADFNDLIALVLILDWYE